MVRTIPWMVETDQAKSRFSAARAERLKTPDRVILGCPALRLLRRASIFRTGTGGSGLGYGRGKGIGIGDGAGEGVGNGPGTEERVGRLRGIPFGDIAGTLRGVGAALPVSSTPRPLACPTRCIPRRR